MKSKVVKSIKLALKSFAILIILLINPIQITYAAQQSVSAKAVVTIGSAPACNIYSIENGIGQDGSSWSDAEKANIQTVCTTLAKSPAVISLLQAAGQIHLARYTNGSLGKEVCGIQVSPDTIEIACDLSSVTAAEYMITHESGHVIQSFNGSVYQAYLNSGAFDQEGLMPTYLYSEAGILGWGGCPRCESFAEMIADNVVSKIFNFHSRTWSGYPGGIWVNPGSGWTTYAQDRPMHYNFAKTNIFGGVEF